MTETTPSSAPVRELTDADKADVRGAYEALQKGIPGFRKRGAQMHMVAAVSRAFSHDGGVAVVEAGTGTGKSLAYLTAGVPIAKNHKLTLVISTGTIALQEQLINRDIPLFLKATKYDLNVRIAKGRQRYACSRNLNEMVYGNTRQSDLMFGDLDVGAWPRPPAPGEVETLKLLTEQIASQQWNGDLDTIPHKVADDLRSAITTSAGACENTKCPYYRECAFIRARSELEAADIIVANHALLLADLNLLNDQGEPGGVLLSDPTKTLYVVDEGHHLPPIARDATAAYAHVAAVQKRLPKLRNLARAAYSAVEKDTIATFAEDDAIRMVGEYETAMEQIASRITSAWVPERTSQFDEPMWVAPLGELPHDWKLDAKALAAQSEGLLKWLRGMRRAVRENETLRPKLQQTLSKELGDAHERLTQVATLWTLWAHDDREGAPPTARWVTLAPRDSSPILHASKVSSADFLRYAFFSRAAGVLVTSATLSAGGDFRAFARDLGLPDSAETMALPSPFNLREQGTLRIPRFRSLPSDRDAHAVETADWLVKNLDWDAGNLVVFTAKSRMEAVFNALPGSRQALVRMQNKAPKAELIASHVAAIGEGKGSTLFGLASFGEGLDLPGKLCTRVVIPSLPFQVPTDPVAQTYAQWIESRGGNSFAEVSVPDAIRVLTQYCGRLIRHEDDVGEISILDRRLAEKSYGRKMLKALPPFKQIVEAAA